MRKLVHRDGRPVSAHTNGGQASLEVARLPISQGVVLALELAAKLQGDRLEDTLDVHQSISTSNSLSSGRTRSSSFFSSLSHSASVRTRRTVDTSENRTCRISRACSGGCVGSLGGSGARFSISFRIARPI